MPKIDVHVVMPSDDVEKRRLKRGELIAVVTMIAAVVAAVPIAIGLGSTGHDGATKVGTAGQHAAVSLEEVVVHNGPASFTSGGEPSKYPGGMQTLTSSPAIDLTLLNSGTERVLVTGVRVDITDFAELPICYTQGGGPVPVSARYTIPLPARPLPSERVIRRAVHEQIPPNDVDRFVFRFGFRDSDLQNDELFRLHLVIGLSGGGAIDLGRFVIGLPGVLTSNGGQFPVDDQSASGAERAGWLALAPTWCYRHNLAEANRLLGQTGERSQQLAALPAVAPSSGWTADHDHTSPRRAAQLLVRDINSGENVQLAVFAAEQTHDAAFVAQIRNAAAAQLTVLGKKALSGHWAAGALEDARASLSILDTREGRDLLARAQVQLATAASPHG